MPGWRFVKQDNDNTAAVASIKDVADCAARADAQVIPEEAGRGQVGSDLGFRWLVALFRAWGSCLAGSAFPDGCWFVRAVGRVKDRGHRPWPALAGARRASLTRAAGSR